MAVQQKIVIVRHCESWLIFQAEAISFRSGKLLRWTTFGQTTFGRRSQ
ncbi:MAG: hypothetical protein HC806_05965 [Anaerolineae bacterium]|nr:hypothetical protein [Anaerolineae bacterium]